MYYSSIQCVALVCKEISQAEWKRSTELSAIVGLFALITGKFAKLTGMTNMVQNNGQGHMDI